MLNTHFFQLLRYAIGALSEVSQLTDEEWQEVYDTAKKQSLVGILLQAITKLPDDLQPPRKLKLNWIMRGEKPSGAYGISELTFSTDAQFR